VRVEASERVQYSQGGKIFMNTHLHSIPCVASWLFRFWLLLCSSALFAAPLEITVGIVPQQSATELARVWIPLLQEASVRSGVRLSFRTAPNISTFEDRLRRGEYDIAYMNPYHYTVFSQTPGYKAFAKEKDRRLVGIVVVAKDSAIADIWQLAGKTVVFPAPGSFAASILPRAEFSRLGIAIQTQYVSSHDSVYLGVAQGVFAAGGGIRRTLEAMDPAVASRLRVLTSTPGYVPHAFAAHPRVDSGAVDKVLGALSSLDRDESGRRLLGQLSFKGIEAATDRDWDEIRRLEINQIVGREP
jgi:phosphonate transport system substrate-binding protein